MAHVCSTEEETHAPREQVICQQHGANTVQSATSKHFLEDNPLTPWSQQGCGRHGCRFAACVVYAYRMLSESLRTKVGSGMGLSGR